jgi:hypothetical protein
MCHPSVAGTGGTVDRGTHKRMAEPDVPADIEQARRHRRADGRAVQSQCLSCPVHQCGFPSHVGGGEQDQLLGLHGQLPKPHDVLILDARGQVPGSRKREPAGQVRRSQAAAQLEQG